MEKILVIGAGVLGCNVAAAFYKAGKNVTLLARGKWYEEIKKNGLCIKDKFFPVEKRYKISVTDELKPDDMYDMVFVSLRYTQLDSIIDTLNANVSQNIVLNGNNTKPEEFKAKLPDKNVMFSFAMAAGSRDEKRVNSVNLKKITIGTLKGDKDRERFVRKIFEGAGYRVVYQPNMGDYLLCHAGFVVPCSFACYYTDGSLKMLVNNEEYLHKLIWANIECYRAIEKTGHEILPKSDQNYMSGEYFKSCYRFYKLMCATPLGKICAAEHAMNAVEEMHALAEDLKEVIALSGYKAHWYMELSQSVGKYL